MQTQLQFFLVIYSTVCLMLLFIFKQATGKVSLVSLITTKLTHRRKRSEEERRAKL